VGTTQCNCRRLQDASAQDFSAKALQQRMVEVPVVPCVWPREGDLRQELEVAGHRKGEL